MRFLLWAFSCVALCGVSVFCTNDKLKEVFNWKYIDYAWEKPEDRDAAVQSGEFVPANNLPLGLEVWKDKLFITVPRWKNGVVATLNYVKISDNEGEEVAPNKRQIFHEPDSKEKAQFSNTSAEEKSSSTESEEERGLNTVSEEDDATQKNFLRRLVRSTHRRSKEKTEISEKPKHRHHTSEDKNLRSVKRKTHNNKRKNKEGEKEERKVKSRRKKEKKNKTKRKKEEKEHKRKKGDKDHKHKKEKKKKNKKKCKPKPKPTPEPTTPPPPPETTTPEVTETTETTETTPPTETTPATDPTETTDDIITGTTPPPPTVIRCFRPLSNCRALCVRAARFAKNNTTPVPDYVETNIDQQSELQKASPPSLATDIITPAPQPSSPAFIPYPSFAENRVFLNGTGSNEASTIVSVFRVSADACDRLWVMDTGVADILGNTEVIFKPRILIYDLNTDKLIKTYEFKNEDTEEHSFFANIIVDSDPQNCHKAFAYVPDLGGYGIVSYDLEKDNSKRLKHNYFHFDPLAGNMNVGGVNFQWTDGVFSIALTKRMDDGFRTAYFHCLASTKEFAVSTKVLQTDDNSQVSYYDYKLVGDRGENSQSSASYIHEDSGIMFYTQLQKDSVNCWNTNKPLVEENLVEVASDNETMIFTNDLKVDRNGNLWVLTDKLPVFIYRNLTDDEINYRIFRSTVQEAVAGTNCAA